MHFLGEAKDSHSNFIRKAERVLGKDIVNFHDMYLSKQGMARELNEILKVRYLTIEPMIKTRGKYQGGTWAVKELVYAYGMYVSADFMLKVIDVFDAAAHGDGVKAVAIAQNNSELKAMIDERDMLMLADASQETRDRIELLTSKISREVKPMAQGLGMLRGRGRSKAITVINGMNQSIQLDIFEGKL